VDRHLAVSLDTILLGKSLSDEHDERKKKGEINAPRERKTQHGYFMGGYEKNKRHLKLFAAH